MFLTGLCFVAVTAGVKSLQGRLPAAEAAFLRYLLGLVFLVPMLRPLLNARIGKRSAGLFVLRGSVHTLGVILWFYAMSRIPMAEVTAMNYLVPVYVSIGAALFLGEKFALRRLLAVGVALIGAVVILRPGFRTLDPGHIAMLGTTLAFAVGYLITKQLTRDFSAEVIVAMLSIVVTIGLAPVAIAQWVPPTLWQCAVLFGVACVATAGHYTMTLAFAAAPVAVTQPVTFLQLLWSVVIGLVIFGESIDVWVVAGGTLIVSAVSFIAWRESVLKKRATESDIIP